MRTILDDVSPVSIRPVFKDSYSNVGIIHQETSPPCHRNSRRCK
jgi:hypothetical protein